ncbi:MAG: VCBS repeat-containing protein [Flavobacteriales bacterium]|nr:VCBS repeat-containing protein [Flavobacteriales bacterium]
MTSGFSQFVDVTAAQGITNVNENTYDGNGLSWYDFNGDGWDDLSLANGDQDPLFFVNNGGTLTPAPFTIDTHDGGHVIMILWADYDNDGDSDVMTTQLGGQLQLWNNDGAFNFTDVGASVGLDTGEWEYWGAAWCDYNHDGWLDVYVAKYYDDSLTDTDVNHRGQLYRSNGNGMFTNVTVTAGVELLPRAIFQPVFFDYDQDGWEDLFLVIDRNAWTNEMYHNNGDGTFTKVSAAVGLNHAFDAMSGTVGDFDNDSDFDIFVTNGLPGNRLYQQDSNHFFTNIASSAGVTVNAISFGALFIDYDNDSWLDIFVSTVAPSFGWGPFQNKFFINQGNSTFIDGTSTVGITGDTSPTFCVAMGDLNSDGYLDYAYNCNEPYQSKIWQNDGGEHHFLSVDLQGVVSNVEGIGSMLHCYAGGQHTINFACSGEYLGAQNSSKEIFGLGTNEVVDSLIIEWNSGIVDSFYNLEVDQFLHVVEGSTTYGISETGNVWLCEGDSMLVSAFGPGTFSWNNGSMEDQLWISEAGTYYVAGTSGNFDYISDSLVVSINVTPEVEIAVSDETCPGFNDGAISLSFENSDTLFVTWDSGEVTNALSGLTPDSYHFTGMDANGCLFEGEVLVEMATPIIVEASATGTTCPEFLDGTVSVSVQNATLSSVNWSNGLQGPVLTELVAGLYEFEGTTEAGCPFDGAVQIEAAEPIVVEIETTAVSCEGEDDGTATVSLANDSISTMEWSNGIDGVVLSGVVSGVYGFEGTTDSGCPFNGEVEIEAAPPFSIAEIIHHVSCGGAEDGSIEITIENEEIAMVNWSIGAEGTALGNLGPGEYGYEGMTDEGCPFSGSVLIESADTLSLEVTYTDVLCAGGNSGTASVIVTGGIPPMTTDWGGADPTALQASVYEVVVTDSAGCQVMSSLIIGEPEALTVTVEYINQEWLDENTTTMGSATALASGGVPPYQYDWGQGFGDENAITDLVEGDYDVVVMDGNGCLVEDQFEIIVIYPGIEDLNDGMTLLHTSGSSFLLQFPANRKGELNIISADGRQVSNFRFDDCEVMIDLGLFAPGLYVIGIHLYGTDIVRTFKAMRM